MNENRHKTAHAYWTVGLWEGSHLCKEFAEVVAFKQTDNGGGDLLHIFSLVDGHDPASVLKAQNQRRLFLSLYI